MGIGALGAECLGSPWQVGNKLGEEEKATRLEVAKTKIKARVETEDVAVQSLTARQLSPRPVGKPAGVEHSRRFCESEPPVVSQVGSRPSKGRRD